MPYNPATKIMQGTWALETMRGRWAGWYWRATEDYPGEVLLFPSNWILF